jgi:hypothetical protein
MLDDLIIEYKKFKKVYNAIKEHNIKEISFEFLVGSCFPNALQNIKEEMRRQYTLGYTAGLKAQQEEKEQEEKTLN